MADWQKIWGTSGSDSSCCPSSCYNFVEPQQNSGNNVNSSRATLLDGLETAISTCAGAIDYYADQLRQRLGAQSVIVSSASDTLFTFTIRMRRKRYTATLSPGVGCRFPVTATCTVGAGSYSASFQSMEQVIDWWVDNIN